ncbi:MAG: dipeptide ABC transporter ATP-binding protein [Pseudomonadota bacterium]
MLAFNNVDLKIGSTPILKDINLEIEAGETLGLVGESGSGKSMTALAIMQLLPRGSSLTGDVVFQGENIAAATEQRLCDLRGSKIGMVFQEPMTALNPVKSIGQQVSEGIRLHTGANRADGDEEARKILDRVGLPSSRYPLERFPHELSGGQRQRVVIAMACALSPDLLIADEPTTALDVSLQAQILELLKELVEENRSGLLLISHDLAVVAETADRIAVMRHGQILEQGPTLDILRDRKHPYTAKLAEASTHVPTKERPPVLTANIDKRMIEPLLTVDRLVRTYPTPRTSLFRPGIPFTAVNEVSFDLYPGHFMGLVGESGCGKSTLARAILALEPPSGGDILYQGRSLAKAEGYDLKAIRRDIQVVFQDPYGSFNPRHTVRRLVAEPLHLLDSMTAEDKTWEVVEALKEVGLQPSDLDKYPHEFSGGQRQRLAIARALITKPNLIIADEPVSALDVSFRAQVLDLLASLRDRLGLTFLFISHDLSVVRAICDEVMVMKDGQIVERGPVNDVFDHPSHAYTRTLIAAAPNLQRAIEMREKSQTVQ